MRKPGFLNLKPLEFAGVSRNVVKSTYGKSDAGLWHEAPVKLANGREAHVTMHVLEGSKEEIEKQLRTSLEAFFDLYPEI